MSNRLEYILIALLAIFVINLIRNREKIHQLYFKKHSCPKCGMNLKRTYVKENEKYDGGSFRRPFGGLRFVHGKSKEYEYILKYRCQNCEKDYNLNEL